MSETLPIIRLEIEGMRHQMVTALNGHHLEIERHVADSLAGINIDSMVRHAVSQHLGPLVQAAIERAVGQAVKGALNGPEVWTSVNQAVYRHVTELVNKGITGD